MLLKIKIFTFLLLISSHVIAQEFTVSEIQEKDKKEVADLLKNVNTNSFSDYESDAQNIVDLSEDIKSQSVKKYQKDLGEISKKVVITQESANYQNSKTWISNNKEKLFAKQTQALPKIDYDITDKQREKDAIAELLHNYRFKPEEVKNSSITHYPLMIFVSSSIPRNSLKDLIIQAKQSGGVLVFRGIIGSLRNTQEFLANISKENVSAIIDPRLFDIFQVKLVPTFVLLSSSVHECLNSDCQFTPKHDRITGNITLKYALEQIESGKGESADIASSYLLKIKGEQEL